MLNGKPDPRTLKLLGSTLPFWRWSSPQDRRQSQAPRLHGSADICPGTWIAWVRDR